MTDDGSEYSAARHTSRAADGSGPPRWLQRRLAEVKAKYFRCPFNTALALMRRRVREGAVYVGLSAGSIVAGRTIATAFWIAKSTLPLWQPKFVEPQAVQ